MKKINAKHAAILLGFLTSVLGTVGSSFFIEGLNKEIGRLTDQRNESSREIELIQAASSEYFLSSQQGDLVYALSLQATARQDIVGLLYKGNLLDRATPIRNLIGSLAIAKVLNYTTVYGQYEKLNDAAREQLSFERFVAVKQFERQIVDQAAQRTAQLHQDVLVLRSKAEETARGLNARQRLGLAVSVLGTTLLLCANLLATRSAESTAALNSPEVLNAPGKPETPPQPSPPPPPPSPDPQSKV